MPESSRLLKNKELDSDKLLEKYHKTRRTARIATVIAIIALLLGGYGVFTGVSATNVANENQLWCSAHATPGPTGAIGSDGAAGATGATGPEGASAYTLWLAVGNKGTLQDFLDSLVGTKGPRGYTGSTGFNGADGADGATGPSGTPGASAYQLWLDAGNEGTPEQFLTSLIGAAGANGTNGTDGKDGTNGTNGTNGLNGAAGLSAYELWVAEGNTGTEADFLASLRGADGVCLPGSGLGAWGSFYDTTTQLNDQAINLMTFNNSDPNSSGVSIQNGSRIVIAKPGTYNIAFSAQVTRVSGGHEADIEIWLRQNGVNYPDSNTAITLQANSQKVVAAWNFFVTTTNENEYFELAWLSAESSMELLHRASNSSPGIPSVILTVNQVH